MTFTKPQLLISVILAYIAILLTLNFVEAKSDSSGFQDHRVFFKDENGTGLVHTASTNEGDLWIYNSGSREVIFVKNPKQSNQLNIIKKELD
ncbi:hypothetical protein JNUCC42_15175 [Brevibacterium sp. JNUCC-42]|nr:hypothetical protein JNUCC42_15175 [Brevibacterium sp. JNUCC-42]